MKVSTFTPFLSTALFSLRLSFSLLNSHLRVNRGRQLVVLLLHGHLEKRSAHREGGDV